jgi:carbon monoxide dehydrogenase subunit G
MVHHHVPHNGPGGIQGAIDGNGHVSFEEDVEGGARITWMDLGLGF